MAGVGICLSVRENRADGANGGFNGGRACWAIAGTLCGGVVTCMFAARVLDCHKCEFYKLVVAEEGTAFQKGEDLVHLLPPA